MIHQILLTFTIDGVKWIGTYRRKVTNYDDAYLKGYSDFKNFYMKSFGIECRNVKTFYKEIDLIVNPIMITLDMILNKSPLTGGDMVSGVKKFTGSISFHSQKGDSYLITAKNGVVSRTDLPKVKGKENPFTW